ncbi:hypothetical protein [Cupriavidus sp. TMH.W2]|uniref:hypothetical protein n=1 Tax=Cupriavidus sp. TMH.W2 TaxID=3434465 RepID=UPI003D777BF7
MQRQDGQRRLRRRLEQWQDRAIGVARPAREGPRGRDSVPSGPARVNARRLCCVLTMGIELPRPARAIHWAPLYTEFDSARVLTTISMPVYAGNQFRGVVAVDVAQKRLHDLLAAATSPDTVRYMVDMQGDVIAAAGSGFSGVLKWPQAVPGNWSGHTPAQFFARGAGMLESRGDVLMPFS